MLTQLQADYKNSDSRRKRLLAIQMMSLLEQMAALSMRLKHYCVQAKVGIEHYTPGKLWNQNLRKWLKKKQDLYHTLTTSLLKSSSHDESSSRPIAGYPDNSGDSVEGSIVQTAEGDVQIK